MAVQAVQYKYNSGFIWVEISSAVGGNLFHLFSSSVVTKWGHGPLDTARFRTSFIKVQLLKFYVLQVAEFASGIKEMEQIKTGMRCKHLE